MNIICISPRGNPRVDVAGRPTGHVFSFHHRKDSRATNNTKVSPMESFRCSPLAAGDYHYHRFHLSLLSTFVYFRTDSTFDSATRLAEAPDDPLAVRLSLCRRPLPRRRKRLVTFGTLGFVGGSHVKQYGKTFSYRRHPPPEGIRRQRHNGHGVDTRRREVDPGPAARLSEH